jgi:hypothetical protein
MSFRANKLSITSAYAFLRVDCFKIAKQLVKPSAPTKQLPNVHLQCYKKVQILN